LAHAFTSAIVVVADAYDVAAVTVADAYNFTVPDDCTAAAVTLAMLHCL